MSNNTYHDQINIIKHEWCSPVFIYYLCPKGGIKSIDDELRSNQPAAVDMCFIKNCEYFDD